MLVAVDHRAADALSQRNGFLEGVAHHHTAAGNHHRELGIGNQVGRRVQALHPARTALDADGLGDLHRDVAVEQVARDVELRRAHFQQRAVEGAGGQLGHALAVGDMRLVLGELGKHGQLRRLLKAAQALGEGARLGCDHHHGAVRPVGGGDGGDGVADARAVLANDHAVAATHTRVTVGHVAGALLVHHGDQADAGGREDVHRVHERGAHDAEHGVHALGDHGLHKGLGGRHAGGAHGDGAGGKRLGCVHGGLLLSGGAEWRWVTIDGLDDSHRFRFLELQITKDGIQGACQLSSAA